MNENFKVTKELKYYHDSRKHFQLPVHWEEGDGGCEAMNRKNSWKTFSRRP